jgi:hypothetical protein
MSSRARRFLSVVRRPGPAPWGLALAGALFLAAAFLAAPRADEMKKPTNLELVRQVTTEAVTKMMSDLPPSGKRVRVRVEPYHEAAWLVQDLVGTALRARGCEVVVVPLTAVAAPPPAPGAAPPGASGQAAAPAAPPAPPSGAAAAGAAAQAALGIPPADSAQAASAGMAAAADSMKAAQGTGAGSAGSAPEVVSEGKVAEKSKAETVPVDAEIELRVVELGLRYTGTHRSGIPLFGGTKVERYALASLHADLHDPEDPVTRWSGNGEAKVIDEVSKDDLAILEGQRYPFSAPALPAQGSSRWLEPLIVSAIVVGLVFLFVSNKS